LVNNGSLPPRYRPLPEADPELKVSLSDDNRRNADDANRTNEAASRTADVAAGLLRAEETDGDCSRTGAALMVGRMLMVSGGGGVGDV